MNLYVVDVIEPSTRNLPSFLASATISSRVERKVYPLVSASCFAFTSAGFGDAAKTLAAAMQAAPAKARKHLLALVIECVIITSPVTAANFLFQLWENRTTQTPSLPCLPCCARIPT